MCARRRSCFAAGKRALPGAVCGIILWLLAVAVVSVSVSRLLLCCCDVASPSSPKRRTERWQGQLSTRPLGRFYSRSPPSAVESGVGSVLERLLALHHTTRPVLNECHEGVLYCKRYSADWVRAWPQAVCRLRIEGVTVKLSYSAIET